MPKVTIDDIAKRAGVSKTSVSFAFNNPDRLSESTLSHILQVAEELGYSPDPLASNLKTRRTGCLGLLVPQPIPFVARNPHMFEFIEGIGDTCHDRGMSLMLVPPLKGNLRRAIVRAAVDGFITIGLEPFRETMKVLQQRGVPFVMVDSDPIPGIPCVNLDDTGGAYAAMQHVLALGHRQIAILGIRTEHSGKYRHYTGLLRRRMEGYIQAIEEAGLEVDNQNIRLVECYATPEEGYRAFKSLWKAKWKVTAVVTMADVMAFGVMQAAHEIGLSIPDDLSLVGFDDIPASQTVTPPLTTVQQPSVAKGRIAAGFLMDLIADRPIESEHIILPVEFIQRDSCHAL
jgi:DNA-binding LacI/PurR family transcriptional regulator